MERRLTIGELATLSHLSVRSLRRYHETGLLVPATVDPASGYRYYGPEQIQSAQVVHRLRELDLPLADIRSLLSSDDPHQRAGTISDHLQRLQAQLDRTSAAMASLRQLLQPDLGALQVDLRSVPTRTVLAVTGDVRRQDVLSWYSGARAKLDAVVPIGERTGPPGGCYANELFTHGRGSVVAFQPVRELRTAEGVEGVELPPVELAVAVHAGRHDDIGVTYGRLGSWVTEHALAVSGPVHETYLSGPADAEDPDFWRTEIGWPVFRVEAP